MKVEFHDLNNGNDELKYVVIHAKHKNKWIFVRHETRSSWEIPGGHIEENELIDEAAARELMEETGALEFRLTPICNYSVQYDNVKSFGRLYYAEVDLLGDLGQFEIAEVMLCSNLPDELTYKEIQPILYKRVLDEIRYNSDRSLGEDCT